MKILKIVQVCIDFVGWSLEALQVELFQQPLGLVTRIMPTNVHFPLVTKSTPPPAYLLPKPISGPPSSIPQNQYNFHGDF